MQQLLEKHDHQIQVEWLPSYSPELNPQEDIWQHMRRRVTHNHYFEQMDALLEAVEDFHQDILKDADARKICGHSPIAATMAALQKLHPEGDVSGRTANYDAWYDGKSSVTFTSLVFEGGTSAEKTDSSPAE